MIFTPNKIISGGQVGADLGALLGARKCGIPTGGTAPKGYRTESGDYKDLLASLGLDEHRSANYPPRTEKNIKDSDATLIFCYDMSSKGTLLAKKVCIKNYIPYYIFDLSSPWDYMPQRVTLGNWLTKTKPSVLNIAGNRESVANGIQDEVMNMVVSLWKKEEDEA